jgi:hypothetical protein
VGADTSEKLALRLGQRWAYHWRPTILTEPEPMWRRLLGYLAEEHAGKVLRKTELSVGGAAATVWPGSNDVGDVGEAVPVDQVEALPF